MKFDINLKLNKKDIDKELKFPNKMSNELAELVGIHFGDGHMSKYNYTYRLHYTCNIKEEKYSKYIIVLFKKLFNAPFSVYKRDEKGCIEFDTYSKSLCEFFNKQLDVPYSPKKELSIPNYIRLNKEYLRYFLRGLFDTDGCFTIQRDGKYNYDLIKICTSIKEFAEEIKLALISLGIDCYICKKKTGFDITIRKKDSFERFMRMIQPRNKNGAAVIRTRI